MKRYMIMAALVGLAFSFSVPSAIANTLSGDTPVELVKEKEKEKKDKKKKKKKGEAETQEKKGCSGSSSGSGCCAHGKKTS